MLEAVAEKRPGTGTARSGAPGIGAAVIAFLFAVSLVRPAFASLTPRETAALGLEASAAQVQAALHTDLDVRDAYNRPVSGERVLSQMSAAARAADPSPRVSRLPMARQLWQALARVMCGFAVRAGLPAPFRPAAPRWAAAKRLSARPAAVALCSALLTAEAICLRPLSAAAAGPVLRNVVLLC